MTILEVQEMAGNDIGIGMIPVAILLLAIMMGSVIGFIIKGTK